MGPSDGLQRQHDPGGIRELADKLDGMADRLDALEETMPGQVDAGIFVAHVTDQIHETVANVTNLILRMRAAAEKMRRTANEQDATEDDNYQTARQLPGDYMEVRPQ